ncbi:hypothetical protein [Streptomyces sp. NBC_01803]|uniref:hypothetical protein n=1 Tax=Streptomyces sp. NBC_01803 TaxID=2975946 RepID=UPI002DD8B07B|nr:hypothetical protein [Streptomyces sp. NBC_01803]WSA43675.1 hypothetical protein OIE51_05325 [Streptomyces sp. NBC_01803]
MPPAFPGPLPTAILGEALLASPRGHLLLMRPPGEEHFRLPGAVVPDGARDWEATASAVRDATGLRVTLLRLVAKDFLPPGTAAATPVSQHRPRSPRQDRRPAAAAARIHLVYNAGHVPEWAVPPGDSGPLPPQVRWVSRDDLDSWCAPRIAARIRAACWAAITGTFAELNHGCPIRRNDVPGAGCPACLRTFDPETTACT